MPAYDTSIRIARPLAEVFTILSDVATWPRWMPVEAMVPIDPGAVRVGMRASGLMAEGSRRAPFSVEITELEPDRRIGFKTLSGPVDWAGSWEARAIDAGTTEVRSLGTMRLRGIGRVLEPLMGAEVRRNEAAELGKLRTLLEGAAG